MPFESISTITAPSLAQPALGNEPPAGSEAGWAMLPADALTQLQLRIAQRADELASAARSDRAIDVKHWLQAEREIWRGRQGS